MHEEKFRFLISVMASLPEKQREIVCLRVQGYTYEQIGKQLGISKRSVIYNFNNAGERVFTNMSL